MTASYRNPVGGIINRSRVLPFRFNGRQYQGFEGDSLASALIANGVRLTARSFKYHRPRGILSCGHDEPGTLVELEGELAGANQAAPTVALEYDLSAVSVNCRPSPDFDRAGINRLLAPFLPAGFYYKTFIWPGWKLYEPFIRRMAGLAHAPAQSPEGGRFDERNWNCDVLIIGAGPAGLAAASVLSKSGAGVMIVDRGTRTGGCLINSNREIEGLPALEWAEHTTSELEERKNVTILRNSEAWAVRDQNLVLVNERRPATPGVLERGWRVRADAVIAATGAGERMLVFPNNDRPGVMLASAIQCYVNRYAVLPGRRAVLFTNNDSAYEVARDMRSAGLEVAAIIDCRVSVPQAVRAGLADVQLLEGYEVTNVLGSRGVRLIEAEAVVGGGKTVIDCDLLGVSGGWDPSVRLWSQAGGAIAYSDEFCCFIPSGTLQDVFCAGGANAQFPIEAAIQDGWQTGNSVAWLLDRQGRFDVPQLAGADSYNIQPFWQGSSGKRTNVSFVDILNDVTVQDVHLALREGFTSIEQVKRYTTAGMGFNQGRTVGPNMAGIVARKSGKSLGAVGVTTFRSPTTPVSFGSIAGGRQGAALLPFRHTPITRWNIEQGAVMYEAGARWRRPGYYPRSGEQIQDAINRESLAVRDGVGVYDGSPLGTFALKGWDAAALLDMLFTNEFSDLPAGSGRYGVMLTDDGRILDDGVGFRTGEHEFLLSVSTGNAPLVARHITKFLAADEPDWQVRFTDLTCQWMNATVCGPDARALLTALGTDIDLSRESFPFMAFREGTVAGIPARVVRVSFTGSLSFEINVRPRDLSSLWNALMKAGYKFGIMPIGSEANHVLRVEKGFISLAHEVDGTVDPYDLGLGWLMSKKKADFLGRRSVELRRKKGGVRRELVGLLTADPSRLVPEGAPITTDGSKCRSEGFVSASVWSVVNNRSVALALLEDGRNRIGGTAWIRLPNEKVQAEIVKPCFYDPSGTVLRS